MCQARHEGILREQRYRRQSQSATRMSLLSSFRHAFRGLGLVLAAELVNTIVERLVDLVHPDHSESVRAIKDVSAGVVLITALGALAVAGLLFLPRLVDAWR